MGYVAAKGGTEAILNAERLVEYFRLRGASPVISVSQVREQLRLAVDRAMSEGALYAPDLAALAVKQSEGDAIEASFLLRAYRSTVPRLAVSLPAGGETIRALRRISASFKDIPGGQMLGPTRDYQLRLLNTLLMHESAESVRERLEEIAQMIAAQPVSDEVGRFPKVVDRMRAEGILANPPDAELAEREEPYDLTRKAISFPAPRSARLQMLARGDVGSLLTYAYSSVRGYGDAHPTLGELRYGVLPVEVAHPLTGEACGIGEILVTECEIVSKLHTRDTATEGGSAAENQPKFGLGYGFTFGHNEVKAISMAILDRVLSSAKEGTLAGERGPAADEEFVLQHIDGIEASGFTAHYKLPHYVDFESNLNVLERAVEHTASHSEKDALRKQEVLKRLERDESTSTASDK